MMTSPPGDGGDTGRGRGTIDNWLEVVERGTSRFRYTFRYTNKA